MTARAGRQVTITWGGTALVGVRQKAIAINGAPLDITSDDDSGWRKLLTTKDVKSVDITISGVAASDILKADAAADQAKAVIVTYPSGFSISGTFNAVDYNETDEYKTEGTFECKLLSSGTVTFTSPSPLV
jgi:predicted secreted protein